MSTEASAQTEPATTPIGELMDFYDRLGERFNEIAFNADLSVPDRYEAVGPVVDEFLGLLDTVVAVYGSHADSVVILGALHRARAELREFAQITTEPYEHGEANDEAAKTNRWMVAQFNLKNALYPLDSRRRLAPPGAKPRAPTDEPPPMTLADPVSVVWVANQIPASRGGGRSDKLLEKMRRRNYKIVMIAGKSHCERKDAIAMFPRFKKRLSPPDDEPC